MKLKIVILAVLAQASVMYSQNDLYVESEMEMDMVFLKRTVTFQQYINSEGYVSKISEKGKEIRVEVQKRDSVIVLDQSLPACMMDTKENYNKEVNENAVKFKLTNVKLEKTEETQMILGYKCKKAIVTYMTEAAMINSKVKMELYYTEDIKVQESTLLLGEIAGYESMLELVKTVQSLDGMVLKNVSTTKTGLVELKNVSVCKKIEKKPAPEDVFQIKDKLCKSPVSAKKYIREVKRREMQQQQQASGSMFPR